MGRFHHSGQKSTSDVLSETFENLSLADRYLTQLENLFDFLCRQYERHLENVRRNFASVDAELRVWLDKCRVGPKRRSYFEAVCEVQSFDEQAFARYAAEIRKWATYYTSRSSIFEALNAFEESLNEKAALVVQSRDPARLANRACILLKEEIKRRCLEKEIASKREILKEKGNSATQQVKTSDPGYLMDMGRLTFTVEDH
uniref:Uncharacterized protein n=1 Tax=Romanomermis culicivorax TaxID=13658 RepID=A0A915KDD5_ROMCU